MLVRCEYITRNWGFRQLTRFQSNSDPVKVLIGAGRTKFYIHEHLLTFTSGFFKKAISNDWKEGVERCVKLPEASPIAFQVFAKRGLLRTLLLQEAGRYQCS
jgi:hypothetical protein